MTVFEGVKPWPEVLRQVSPVRFEVQLQLRPELDRVPYCSTGAFSSGAGRAVSPWQTPCALPVGFSSKASPHSSWQFAGRFGGFAVVGLMSQRTALASPKQPMLRLGVMNRFSSCDEAACATAGSGAASRRGRQRGGGGRADGTHAAANSGTLPGCPTPPESLWQYTGRHRARVIWATVLTVLNKVFDVFPEILIGVAIDVVVNENDSFVHDITGVDGRFGQLVVLAIINGVVWIARVRIGVGLHAAVAQPRPDGGARGADGDVRARPAAGAGLLRGPVAPAGSWPS